MRLWQMCHRMHAIGTLFCLMSAMQELWFGMDCKCRIIAIAPNKKYHSILLAMHHWTKVNLFCEFDTLWILSIALSCNSNVAFNHITDIFDEHTYGFVQSHAYRLQTERPSQVSQLNKQMCVQASCMPSQWKWKKDKYNGDMVIRGKFDWKMSPN